MAQRMIVSCHAVIQKVLFFEAIRHRIVSCLNVPLKGLFLPVHFFGGIRHIVVVEVSHSSVLFVKAAL